MERKLELYCIETHTGLGHRTRAKAKIYVTLHGSFNSSERIPLSQSSEERPVAFKKGYVDSFYLVLPEITNLSGLSLSCETRGWNVEYVMVKVAGRSYKAVFNATVERTEVFQPLALITDNTSPFMEGRILLGPMLKLRGNYADLWRLSVMLVTENVAAMPGPISFNVGAGVNYSAPPVCYYSQNNNQMWRFDFDIRLADFEQVCIYRLPGYSGQREYSINIPARNQKPGILFCSCNDRAQPFHMTPNDNAHKSVGWDYMLQQISTTKYHLLILGGDQIYADTLFYACESVRTWDALPKTEKYVNSAQYFTPKSIAELNCYYFSMYIFCWAYYAMAAVTASVPTAMMYDDHDIYDGWGSLDPHVNDSDMMINIFKIAKKHFFLFQMQGDLSPVINERLVVDDPIVVQKVKDTPTFESFGYPQILRDQGPFNSAIEMTGGVSVILLDLRTERRMFTHNAGIIMRENSYRNFEKFLVGLSQRQEPQHVFLVCTVPIHYPDATLFNKLLDVTHHNLIDDVRDHYSAIIHRAEQARVLNDLAGFLNTAPAGSRATILSGDVHLAAFTTADVQIRAANPVHIEQYISSGIAALPPPKFAQIMMQTPLFRNNDKIACELSTISQAMRRLPTGKYFFRSQNFLCLSPTPESYAATWVGNPFLKKVNKQSTEVAYPLPPPIRFGRNLA